MLRGEVVRRVLVVVLMLVLVLGVRVRRRVREGGMVVHGRDGGHGGDDRPRWPHMGSGHATGQTGRRWRRRGGRWWWWS